MGIAPHGSHRSGRAPLRHPARQVTGSLRTGTPAGTAEHGLSTLRPCSHLPGRQTRFRLPARLYRVGLATHRVPTKGFCVAILTSLPPFPSFLGASLVPKRAAVGGAVGQTFLSARSLADTNVCPTAPPTLEPGPNRLPQCQPFLRGRGCGSTHALPGKVAVPLSTYSAAQLSFQVRRAYSRAFGALSGCEPVILTRPTEPVLKAASVFGESAVQDYARENSVLAGVECQVANWWSSDGTLVKLQEL